MKEKKKRNSNRVSYFTVGSSTVKLRTRNCRAGQGRCVSKLISHSSDAVQTVMF